MLLCVIWMNFYGFGYYIYIPISILALKIASKNINVFHKIPLVFVFFSAIILMQEKINFVREIFMEPQKNIYSINNLVEKKWKSDDFVMSKRAKKRPYIIFLRKKNGHIFDKFFGHFLR